MKYQPRLLRSSMLVSAITLLSRMLGFARDVIIAHIFGASADVDAFLVAFKIPNFMRRLFAEGTFSQAFIPILGEYREHHNKLELKRFLQPMIGTFAFILLFISIGGVFAATFLIKIFAPGFAHDVMRATLAANLLRWCLPYLFFISLTAFAGALLNSIGNFFVPAITPVVLNIVLIICAATLASRCHIPIYALAYGIFIAGILQLLLQIPFLYRHDFLVMPQWSWRHPAVALVYKRMLPAIFGISVAQINLIISIMFASFLPIGTVSWLYYAERLCSFPQGLCGIAIATVILPYLSQAHSSRSTENYNDTLEWAIRIVLLIACPAALGLALLAYPLLTTLFHYGHFREHDVLMAQQCLIPYACGIPAFMLIKILATAFYAQKNVTTPVKIAVIAVCANVVMNALFILPWQHAGLALATSLAAWINACLLAYYLIRHHAFHFTQCWKIYLLRLLVANSVMAFVLSYFLHYSWIWSAWDWQQRSMHLFFLIILGILCYFSCLLTSGWRFKELKR